MIILIYGANVIFNWVNFKLCTVMLFDYTIIMHIVNNRLYLYALGMYIVLYFVSTFKFCKILFILNSFEYVSIKCI